MRKPTLKARVKEYILDLIRAEELKAGDKLPTQRELSRICGTSQKISELALSELEVEGVLFRQVGRGSFLLDPVIPREEPARPGNVFVLVPNLRNPQFTEFVSEIEARLAEAGLKMRLVTREVYSAAKELQNLMAEEGVGGIIGFQLPPEIRAFARSCRIPYVQLAPQQARNPECRNCDAILFDMRHGAGLLAEHLLTLGHRSFYLCGDDPSYTGYRFQVMKKLLLRAGCEVKCIPQPVPLDSTYNYQKVGADLADAIIADEIRGTAAVFYNAIRALGAMKRFMQKNISIPKELSICGFDDIRAARLVEPELTTLDSRYLEAAGIAVRLLLESGRAEPRKLLLEPRLVAGNSCVAPPNKAVELPA